MRMSAAFLFAVLLLGSAFAGSAQEPAPSETLNTAIFDRENLVAWCIVPFDSKKRGPEARAEMLSRLGISMLAYDWRAEHIPTFDEEIETLDRWGIKLQAFWFPGALNDEAKAILDALKRQNVQTELWVSMHGGEIACTPEEHVQRVRDHAAALRPIVAAAAEIGCTVGLYNHGGWFGEPENQIEILKALDAPNAGLVYNLHHGHGHIDRFPELLASMKPYLLCLNLNGMKRGGDQMGDKILPLGNGELDLQMLRTIAESGYAGPIGVLGHTMDDAEETLADNLDGLDWLVAQLEGNDAGTRPPLRVGRETGAAGVASLSPAFGKALSGGMVAEGSAAYRTPPVTVELRAKLRGSASYNILVANETKASGAHWEIFTEAGSGNLCVYTPGLEPDHTRTSVNLCDSNWHQIAMHYELDRIRLYVNGEMVAEQAVQSKNLPVNPGGIAVGRLVEGHFFCDGEIDDVRISRGVRPISVSDTPLAEDDTTLQLWNFDDLSEASALHNAPEVEDPLRRAALPEFQVIPAAKMEALAESLPVPDETFACWQRSHGDPHNTRYSALRQITRDNVSQLKLAWEYRSKDGPGNVQCNPIVVDGVMFAPTSGENLVAVNAATGEEQWRFEPEGRPAFRGLTFWPGNDAASPRLFVNSGNDLWAIDPANGIPLSDFGVGGRVVSGEVRVAAAVFEDIVIVPGFLRDVFGYNAVTGERCWTFETVPGAEAYGGDTWSKPGDGANCWGGIALDEQRGIVYVSTGSPKPNFAGNTHTGQNLFANCLIALDARTGERRWHFQEIRHDIWDMDIPAPPNLVSLDWQGRKVDAVAQVTKLGNTLLLDRVSGEPLFPFRLRRAPVSRLPGERTWPYQPAPELPEPFARQAFTEADVTSRTPEAREHVLNAIANANLGSFAAFEENKPTVLYGIHGGAEWTGAAFDPRSGRLYVSANNIPWIVTVFQPDPVVHDPNAPPTPGRQVYDMHCVKCHGPDRFGVGMAPPLHGLARRTNDEEVRALVRSGRNAMPAIPDTVSDDEIDALMDYIFLRDLTEGTHNTTATQGPIRYTHNGYPKLLDHEGYPGCEPPWGTLNCLDLASGKLIWQVPLGYYPELAIWGEDDTGAENFGGPSVTAGGLVFCAGTPDHLIRAFDADTGAVLWEHELPFGGYAPPAIYEADGREFVVIAASGGGKLGTPLGDAYVAFSLG